MQRKPAPLFFLRFESQNILHLVSISFVLYSYEDSNAAPPPSLFLETTQEKFLPAPSPPQDGVEGLKPIQGRLIFLPFSLPGRDFI